MRRGLRVCKAAQFNDLVKNGNFGGSLVFPGDVLLLPRAYSVMIYGIHRGEDDPQPSFGAWWPMLHKDAFAAPVEQQAANSLAAGLSSRRTDPGWRSLAKLLDHLSGVPATAASAANAPTQLSEQTRAQRRRLRAARQRRRPSRREAKLHKLMR